MIVNEEAVKKILEEVKPAKLVAATKYVDVKEIEKLEKLGVTCFGENRVQAFLEKYENYHGNGEFQFIGTLQPNKVKYIIDKVTLIHAVDRYSLLKEIEKLEKLGVTCFGENRVQAFLEKYENYHGNGEFQFIGTLQPNKVKYIIDKVTLIHAVDRYSLLKEIEKQAAKRDLEMPVLIQVNIAKEESKHGFEVEEIDEVFNCLKDYPHVKVRGLMMMAPHIESSETEKYFKMTQELLQRLQKDYPMYQLDQLSMGMSNDYHEALNHGSTMIRIGSALFK